MLILHTVDLDNNIVCVQCMFVQRPAEMGVAERKVFVARLRLVVRLKVSHLNMMYSLLCDHFLSSSAVLHRHTHTHTHPRMHTSTHARTHAHA